ncbi:MAG: hypothetical protein RSA15_03185, partial [Bacilli bacterium]
CLTGCGKEKNIKKQKEKKKETPIIEKKYVDDNPIKLGIYAYENGIPNLQSEIYHAWNPDTPISYFSIFYTNEKSVSPNKFQDVFRQYQSTYTDIEKYKIGYSFEFKIDTGETIIRTVKQPDDVWSFFDYVQVYMYDDFFHELDSWYSHTEQKDFNENSLFTTFKICSGFFIDKVVSDITVTAFTYDDEEDFKEGIYRGNSKATMIVRKP